MSAQPGGLFRRRARPRAATIDDLLMTAIASVLGGLLMLTLLFWATGQVSGRFFGGGWPRMRFSKMGPVMISALQHPGDPAAAWPASAGRLVPEAVPFYLTMFLLFLIPAVIAIMLLARLLRGVPLFGGMFGLGWRTRRSSNTWAKPRDLKPLVVDGPRPGRLTLGRVNGRLLAAEPGQSVIVLGPQQSLKTAGFAAPSILEWQGPVVATSLSPDLILDTLDRRRELGTVWVYDPTASTTLPRSGWTPLDQSRTWAEALRVANALASAAHEANRGDQDGWLPEASNLVAPLLFAAANSGRLISDVVRWVQHQEQDEVLDAIEKTGEVAPADALQGIWRLDDHRRSEIYAAAQFILSAYADPLVAESARVGQLSPDRLLDGGNHTAYLTVPPHEAQRLRPLFSALLHEIIATVYERVVETGEPLDPPLLLVLDDAADIGAVRALDVYASTAASNGIQLVSIFHDLAQVRASYGDRGDTVVNNHRARVIMSGTSDADTLEYLANLLGDEEIRQIMESFGEFEGFSETAVSSYRRVTPAEVLREIQPGEGLLIYGYLAPAELKLRPWFADRELRALAGGRRHLEADRAAARRAPAPAAVRMPKPSGETRAAPARPPSAPPARGPAAAPARAPEQPRPAPGAAPAKPPAADTSVVRPFPTDRQHGPRRPGSGRVRPVREPARDDSPAPAPEPPPSRPSSRPSGQWGAPASPGPERGGSNGSGQDSSDMPTTEFPRTPPDE